MPGVWFQSTHPYRVWHFDPPFIIRQSDVSIHTPIQGVTGCAGIIPLLRICFNPHTHTGCDHNPGMYRTIHWVSIHTPIQGVTTYRCWYSAHPSVSIHTPIQGVTFMVKNSMYKQAVSIHTPIQGVTIGELIIIGFILGFNPHTHTGCDYLLPIDKVYQRGFNPHTHTGCDPVSAVLSLVAWCFNPHTHTGCDALVARKECLSSSFNPHTHTGCDQRSLPTWLWHNGFQSTHPYRVWPSLWVEERIHLSFNPHTHTGCDAAMQPTTEPRDGFNPHTHTGCDRKSYIYILK